MKGERIPHLPIERSSAGIPSHYPHTIIQVIFITKIIVLYADLKLNSFA